MPERTNLVHAQPDHGGYYAVKLDGLGLFITAGLDDEGQPYVSVNTEDMSAEHTYDERTGLRGDARPYAYEEEAGGSAVVLAPWLDLDGEPTVIARHFGKDGTTARLAARQHAEMLNDLWSTCCGMPMISVHLGDAELYDAREHGAPKTEEETADA